VFGHESKPRSHWLYRVPDPGTVKAYSAESMIVEVRGDNRCTVFPGSMHQSGEMIEFENPEDYHPAKSTWAELVQGTTKVAIASVLYPYWSEDSHKRHVLALALGAFLARRDWNQRDVAALVDAIAKEAHDQELEDRLRGVDDTFAAYSHGNPISGDEELAQLIGTDLTGHIGKWMSVRASKKGATRRQDSQSHSSSAPENRSVDITTDATAADAFTAAFKGRLVYSNGQWFYRGAQVLEVIPVEFVQGLAKHFFQEQVGKIATASFVFSPLKSMLSRTRINATVELSRASFYVDPASIDNDTGLLGLADGNVLELSTGNTLGNDEALVTRKIGTTLECKARCPIWHNFLEEIFQKNAQVI
jgi:hypothetical protein